ncbi:MAG: T9SS type A sorting domain-containing protein, partial [Bacteroidota bacterium]
FTFDVPPLAGYQILPRFTSDLALRPDPSVSFATANDTVAENGGSATVSITITNPNPDATDFLVSVTGGTATAGTDFAFADTTVSVAGCDDVTIDLTITITDDMDTEGDETIELSISNLTNNATAGTDALEVVITDDDGVSIDNLLPANAIRLYPNPASSSLQLDAQIRLDEVVILNTVGQVVMQKEINAQQAELNVSALPVGMYILQARSEEGNWTGRWIKQ